MTTLVINLQASTVWKNERVDASIRCSKCHAVYPGRLMMQVTEGVCDECRGAVKL